MGFAGHAVLGGRLHRKLRTAFPSALMLPVLMLPEDHVSEEWTRRIIWDQYETLLEGANCLLTARVGGHFGEDDARLATGLAGIEVADFEEDGVAVSALAASCRRLSTTSGGWLGMATVKRKMPLARKFEWLHLPPWWRQYAAVGEDEELPNAVGQAIWPPLTHRRRLRRGWGRAEQLAPGGGGVAAGASRSAGTAGYPFRRGAGTQQPVRPIPEYGHRL